MAWSSLLTTGRFLSWLDPLTAAYLSTHRSTRPLICSLRGPSDLPDADTSNSVTADAASAIGEAPPTSPSSDHAVEACARYPPEKSETTGSIFGSTERISASISGQGTELF